MAATITIFYFVMFIFHATNANSDIELLIKKKAGSPRPFQGHKVVRAFPQSKSDVELINSLEVNPDIEVDFWARSINTDIHVGPEDYSKLDAFLKQSNIKFNILNDNLQASLDEDQRAHYRHSKGWHDDYHNFEQIMQKLDNLGNVYKSRTTVLNLGKTYEKRPIMGIEIKGATDVPNKQKVLMICGQHAREWISPATCMYMMDKMLQNYQKDPKITAMVDRFNWVIVPVTNPDGYAYTWTSEENRLWRKNREPNAGSSCHGIDLNRNWEYEFAGAGSSGEPCSDIYRGSAPFSSQETKAIADYAKANQNNIFCFMDIHSYSQLWMFPWSYTKKPAKDHDELSRVSKLAVKALDDTHGTKFAAGPASVTIYRAAGSGKDWAYGSLGVKYSFAIELRDTGEKGFVLPKEQIVPTGEEMLASLQTMAKTMMDYGQKKTTYYRKQTVLGIRKSKTPK